VELDHVLLAVDDLERAARALEEQHGLASLEGGRHPGWGTANRIVPLGDAYLELIAVADEEAAAANPFGRWVGAAARDGFRPLGWCVRPRDLDGVARRLGLAIAPGARERPDGTVLRWRLAGVEEAVREPALPFFIEWEPGALLPGQAAVSRVRLARLELTGDEARLAKWLGPYALPVVVRPGEPAVEAVVVTDAVRPGRFNRLGSNPRSGYGNDSDANG